MLPAKKTAACLLLAAIPLGCTGFLNSFELGSTSIRLINNGTFGVSATIVYDTNENVPDSDIGNLGTQTTVQVPAGQSVDIAPIPCPLIHAVKVLDATLQTGSNPPHTHSDTFREGPDYACGDRVIFTFSNSILLIDFSVKESRERP